MSRLVLVSLVDPALVSALGREAEPLGISVVALPNRELLERSRSGRPDLVLLDAAARDTMEVLSLLKSGQRTKGVPVVVLTSSDALELRELAMEVGADAVLEKPLGPGALARLSAMLGSSADDASAAALRPSRPR